MPKQLIFVIQIFYAASNRNQKLSITRAIINSVKKREGRFLSYSTSTKLWEELTDSQTLSKVRQSLREGQRKITEMLHNGKMAEMLHNGSSVVNVAINIPQPLSSSNGRGGSCVIGNKSGLRSTLIKESSGLSGTSAWSRESSEINGPANGLSENIYPIGPPPMMVNPHIVANFQQMDSRVLESGTVPNYDMQWYHKPVTAHSPNRVVQITGSHLTPYSSANNLHNLMFSQNDLGIPRHVSKATDEASASINNKICSFNSKVGDSTNTGSSASAGKNAVTDKGIDIRTSASTSNITRTGIDTSTRTSTSTGTDTYTGIGIGIATGTITSTVTGTGSSTGISIGVSTSASNNGSVDNINVNTDYESRNCTGTSTVTGIGIVTSTGTSPNTCIDVDAVTSASASASVGAGASTGASASACVSASTCADTSTSIDRGSSDGNGHCTNIYDDDGDLNDEDEDDIDEHDDEIEIDIGSYSNGEKDMVVDRDAACNPNFVTSTIPKNLFIDKPKTHRFESSSSLKEAPMMLSASEVAAQQKASEAEVASLKKVLALDSDLNQARLHNQTQSSRGKGKYESSFSSSSVSSSVTEHVLGPEHNFMIMVKTMLYQIKDDVENIKKDLRKRNWYESKGLENEKQGVGCNRTSNHDDSKIKRSRKSSSKESKKRSRSRHSRNQSLETDQIADQFLDYRKSQEKQKSSKESKT